MKPNLNTNSNQGYSIGEVLYILRKNYRVILFSSITLFLFICYYTFNSPSIYKSTTSIMVSKDQSSMNMLEVGFVGERNYIDNELSVLQSRTTSDLVIKKLLNNDMNSKSLHLFGNGNSNSLTSIFFDNKENNRTSNLDSSVVFDKFSKSLRNSVSFANNLNTDIITISVESTNPEEAALIANTFVSVYKSLDLEWVTGEMTHLKSFLTQQIDEKEKDLRVIEEKLKLFQENEKIFSLDENSSILLSSLTEFESMYNNILASISISREKEKYLREKLTDQEKNLSDRVSNKISDRLYALEGEMSNLEIELISTISKYGPNHSAVEEIKLKIDKIKESIKKETRKLIDDGLYVSNPILYRQSIIDSLIVSKAEIAGLISKGDAYSLVIKDYEKSLESLPEKILEFARLERIRAVQEETFKFMSQKLEEARIGEASKLSKIRIIDYAIPIYKPIKPKKKQNIFFGFVLALSFGVFCAFIRELFDNTVKSIEQIERRGLSILALIPNLTSRKRGKYKSYKKNNKAEKLERQLITREDPKSPISEAYRSLRTSLLFSNVYNKNDKQANIILVSSSGPGEGKTTTVANLAITYANLGKKTLLIDSDLRKPVIHNVFHLDKSPGLTNYLASDSNMNDIIKQTTIDNLSIVTSGIIPPNPSELLHSKQMDIFIKQIKIDFDVILFDSPPLIAVTDAYVIMNHINQFILVVRSGVTQRGALERVLSTMEHSNKTVDGVVMNAVSEQNSYGSGYYYNYYQYYYSEE